MLASQDVSTYPLADQGRGERNDDSGFSIAEGQQPGTSGQLDVDTRIKSKSKLYRRDQRGSSSVFMFSVGLLDLRQVFESVIVR